MTITHMIPILPARNLDDTQAFYTDKLGFALETRYDTYLIVACDGVELHFTIHATLNPHDNYGQAYVRVTGIDALYAAYAAHNVIHPNGAIKTQAWGMREFAVLDPDHNLLRFGEEVAEA
jgi:catechol 2,3-dioxygenase-like lactoylglutathione lyase family enzyme